MKKYMNYFKVTVRSDNCVKHAKINLTLCFFLAILEYEIFLSVFVFLKKTTYIIMIYNYNVSLQLLVQNRRRKTKSAAQFQHMP